MKVTRNPDLNKETAYVYFENGYTHLCYYKDEELLYRLVGDFDLDKMIVKFLNRSKIHPITSLRINKE